MRQLFEGNLARSGAVLSERELKLTQRRSWAIPSYTSVTTNV